MHDAWGQAEISLREMVDTPGKTFEVSLDLKWINPILELSNFPRLKLRIHGSLNGNDTDTDLFRSTCIEPPLREMVDTPENSFGVSRRSHSI
jgi:hypothetical protein